MINNIDCIDYLNQCLEEKTTYNMIFADPPDNLGLEYSPDVQVTNNSDQLPAAEYYGWLESILIKSMHVSPVVWMSYYWKHDLEVKHIIRNLLKFHYNGHSVKTFFWRFTFGQHNSYDCGSGFRFLVRIIRNGTPIYPDEIREESARQRMGDPRADSRGRVPDDVWEFPVPRVTGNSSERRKWHPTQHPVELLRRIIKLSTKANDTVLDLFGGTASCERACIELNRLPTTCELSKFYCDKVNAELYDGMPY